VFLNGSTIVGRAVFFDPTNKENDMKRIVGLLSGAALVFTGAASAASISTIDMAPGLAGANLKNLATERNTRYALMVSYPVGLTAQPTILDTATGKTGQKCGVDKQCRSPFNFRRGFNS